MHEPATPAISQVEVAHHQKEQRAGGTANAYSTLWIVGRASAQCMALLLTGDGRVGDATTELPPDSPGALSVYRLACNGADG